MACKKCGSEDFEDIPGAYPGGHKCKRVCAICGEYLQWVKGEDSDAYRRPAKHRKLVEKYGQGFCELCRRTEEEIPAPQTLEAQHVKEYVEGGDEKRENIWIVCTSCHRLIHHQRTYLGHCKTQNQEAISEDF